MPRELVSMVVLNPVKLAIKITTIPLTLQLLNFPPSPLPSPPFPLLFLLFLLETQFLCIALTVLDLTIQTRLA